LVQLTGFLNTPSLDDLILSLSLINYSVIITKQKHLTSNVKFLISQIIEHSNDDFLFIYLGNEIMMKITLNINIILLLQIFNNTKDILRAYIYISPDTIIYLRNHSD
jgi:small basic protein